MERGSEASCQNLLTFVLPLCKEADFPWLKHVLLKILSCVTVLLYLSTIAPAQATSGAGTCGLCIRVWEQNQALRYHLDGLNPIVLDSSISYLSAIHRGYTPIKAEAQDSSLAQLNRLHYLGHEKAFSITRDS